LHLQRSEKATLIKFGIYLFHFFVFLWLATRHYLDEIRDGGNIWTTADWFVSYKYGFVRRGAIGTIIEFLSQDLMGDSLLLFIFLILHVLIGVYFLLICRIFVARVNFGAIPLVVLLLSPIYI
jgi:hypothetical protein